MGTISNEVFDNPGKHNYRNVVYHIKIELSVYTVKSDL